MAHVHVFGKVAPAAAGIIQYVATPPSDVYFLLFWKTDHME